VTVTYTFAGLPVADFAAAYDWYVQLLGRAADMAPHETEAVWRLTPNSAIYVVQDAARAGRGLLTIALDDLEAQIGRMHDAGIDFVEVPAGNAPRRINVTDCDGNTVTFFQDPPGEV
jgi:catechol 2,3-dioxygenase-like lactoylglutathione lyase family enzyme